MVEIFKYVDKFFTSLTNYLTYNYIFIIFVGLFLFTMLSVFFFTSRSYEARLIKAVDKFNTYFIDNPHINEENLVAFNAKMKDKKVPKQLRKHWQQFVLYREDKASTYMSFENCVANPIKNSTYTRDVKLMNTLAWIFSFCALILNFYYCFETVDFAAVLRSVLLTPIIILLLNYVSQIFLNLRHNAIVSDLFQNYQYFEVNIDKATETIPEYVDYEVLFDRNEIKKGIPILYAYLQKRAEEEQRELERARLKNVEHEKFNFDDQGVAASLVLERAMQEAENYIAERKKYNQDIAQINSDITQEDMNYREITKEYNRQMQVSKETFANFKSQLEEVSSTIEANYLKKQQQQELDRQRNLERDFDTATERHKKIIESYHAELDSVDKFIAQSRKNLEDAMKSEFSSYSSKVYDEAKKLVEEREQNKVSKLKQDINSLEEKLITKSQELEHVYQQNQVMNDKLEEIGVVINDASKEEAKAEQKEETKVDEPVNPEKIIQVQETSENVNEENKIEEELVENEVENEYLTDEPITNSEQIENNNIVETSNLSNIEDEQGEKEISTEPVDDSIKPVSKRGRPRKVVDTTNQGEKKKPGRPRKVVEETSELKRKVGRPRKEETQTVQTEQKRGRGRPRKEEQKEPKRKVGRPKKVEAVETKPVAKRGRPRKVTAEPAVEEAGEQKRKVGRPKKTQEVVNKPAGKRGRPRKIDVNVPSDIQDIDAYLKEIDSAIAAENAKLEQTQKELENKAKLKGKK